MSFKSFREGVLYSVRGVGSRFTAPDEDWEPMLLLQLAPPQEPEIIMVPAELTGSPEAKERLVNKFVPDQIRTYRARGFAMVLSSWAVRPTGEEFEIMDRTGREIRASGRPDRTEIVMVYIADYRNREVWIADIVRHEKRPPALGNFRILPPSVARYDKALSALDDNRRLK